MSERKRELYQKLCEAGKKIGLPTNYLVSWEPILHNKELLMVLRFLARGDSSKEDIREYLRTVDALAVDSKKCLENIIDLTCWEPTTKK